MFELFREHVIFKTGGRKVKVFKKHIKVPLTNQNQCFHPLTHEKWHSHTSTGKGPSAPIDENTGCNADPVNSQIRGVATDFFPKGGNEGGGETKRKLDTSRAFQSLPSQGWESLAQRCWVSGGTLSWGQGLTLDSL